MKNILNNLIAKTILIILTIVFLVFGSFSLLYVEDLPVVKILKENILYFLILIFILLIFSIIPIIIGTYILKWSKIDSLRSFFGKAYEIIDYWEFKDLIVNANSFIENYYNLNEMIVYGVDFSKTANDPKEQKKLLRILGQKDFKKVTFICTVYSPDRYSDIFEHVKKFINCKNFKKYMNKIEIFGHKSNPLHIRLILLDHKYVLYQPDMPAANNSYLKIKDLAIKVIDPVTVSHFYGKVSSVKDDLDSENILKTILGDKEKNLYNGK